MKKVLALACILSAAALLAGCGNSGAQSGGAQSAGEETADAAGSEEGTKETAAEDSGGTEKKTFTVGFDAEFPPYDAGEYVGFDLDLARAVCEKNGWEFVAQPIDWDAKDMELSSGAIDCIWNGFTMNGREDDYTWGVPYIDNSQVFVVGSCGEGGRRTEGFLGAGGAYGRGESGKSGSDGFICGSGGICGL